MLNTIYEHIISSTTETLKTNRLPQTSKKELRPFNDNIIITIAIKPNNHTPTIGYIRKIPATTPHNYEKNDQLPTATEEIEQIKIITQTSAEITLPTSKTHTFTSILFLIDEIKITTNNITHNTIITQYDPNKIKEHNGLLTNLPPPTKTKAYHWEDPNTTPQLITQLIAKAIKTHNTHRTPTEQKQ